MEVFLFINDPIDDDDHVTDYINNSKNLQVWKIMPVGRKDVERT